MEPDGEIARCIHNLAGGDRRRREEAARELWERFFADLTCLARRWLRALNTPKGAADEEDAAARAFTKVCRGIECGRLKPHSGLDLVKVLRFVTAREVLTLHAQARRQLGRACDESILVQVPDRQSSPECRALAWDTCRQLLELLDDDELRWIVVWKLAGHTNDTIRIKLGCSLTKVERALARIRETWQFQEDHAMPSGPPRTGPRRGSAARRETDTPTSDPLESGDTTIQLARLMGIL